MAGLDELPSALPAGELFASILLPGFDRVRGYLEQLAVMAPQVLLFEGGTADERKALALWWAARLNCPASAPPCLSCSTCRQFSACNNHDMFFLDGSAASIKIDDVRTVRAVLGEPPRGRQRVVVLAEAQALGIEAANALLKSLEEPRPGTSFVLLVPQRERLLPTLVSRSWILTLAWPMRGELAPAVSDWIEALARFIADGQGWFALSGAKGALDNAMALQLVACLQQQLVEIFLDSPKTAFARMLASRLDTSALRKFDEALAECQDALFYNVQPALVMDWLAIRLYAWARTARDSL